MATMTTDAITAAALEPILRDRLAPDATCGEPTRAAAGNGQETWFVDACTAAGERPLVLRRSAPDGTLAWTDRSAEFAVIEAVGAQGLPVPHVLWLDPDGGPLERPYFVMERRPGRVPGRLDPAGRDAVSRELGTLLARLHAVDADALDTGLERFGDPRAAALAELAAWRGRYAADRLAPMPLLGALLAWLEANVPDLDGPVRVLWGDAGPHNLLVADDAITALLDWELVHLGHPLDDVAVAQWSCFGTLDEEALLAGYEAAAGPVDRAALRWFRCLACVSRTVMLLGGIRAYAEGRTAKPSLAGLGLDLVARTLARGAQEAGWAPAGPAAEGTAAAAPAGPAQPARPNAPETAAGVARFLHADVLPATTDPALRRGLKTAVALLETVALRAAGEPAVLARRDARARAFLAAHGLGHDLEAAARRCELDPELAGSRAGMRALLLEDLAAGDALLAPLRRLFGG